MGYTFLVVDDDAREGDALLQLLGRLHPAAELLRATSGADAVAALEEHRVVPSLIFLDYDLGGENAISALGEIRQRLWLERAPVCVISDRVPDRVVVNCYRLGVAAFLTRPLSLYELREAIRDHARPALRMTAARVVPAPGGHTSLSAA